MSERIEKGASVDLEERPWPTVVGRCKVCASAGTDAMWRRDNTIVSPSGVEHVGLFDAGDTICGHDATGPEWTWPL